MLEAIQRDGGDVKKYVKLAKDKNSNFRLMGFGHRVYKNFDPRATIIKAAADKVLGEARHQGSAARHRAASSRRPRSRIRYFVERKLYPNVDFYRGIIYRALGFPTNMFTVHVRARPPPGWIAHWKEMNDDPTAKIGRPRQIYTGENAVDYTPLDRAP